MGVGLLYGAWVDEHLVVEVAFVDAPHVDEAEEGDGEGGARASELAVLVEEHEGEAYADDDEGAEGVGCEYGASHVAEVLGNLG